MDGERNRERLREKKREIGAGVGEERDVEQSFPDPRGSSG